MSYQPVKGAFKQVKPLLSTDAVEARRRVMKLYRAWYRQIPETVVWNVLPVTVSEARAKLKHEFMKNKGIRDIRVIDMLVIKGQMELKEIVQKWKQSCHCMYYFKSTAPPKPTNFLSKFLSGND